MISFSEADRLFFWQALLAPEIVTYFDLQAQLFRRVSNNIEFLDGLKTRKGDWSWNVLYPVRSLRGRSGWRGLDTCVIERRQIDHLLGEVHPRTGHEEPEREYMYSCTISLTSVRDRDGWPAPRPSRFTRGKDPVPIV
jgi:hypothetical protein